MDYCGAKSQTDFQKITQKFSKITILHPREQNRNTNSFFLNGAE